MDRKQQRYLNLLTNMNGAYYTPFFCEENVWQLGKSVKEEFFYQYRVLFLTNRSSSIALMNQKAAPKDQFIFWDYHVILHNTSSKIIFDYDSRLGFETDFEFYFRNTFVENNQSNCYSITVIYDHT